MIAFGAGEQTGSSSPELPCLPARGPTAHLHHQCDRISQLPAAENHQDQRRLPERTGCHQAALSRPDEHRAKAHPSGPCLENSSIPARHLLWRTARLWNPHSPMSTKRFTGDLPPILGDRAPIGGDRGPIWSDRVPITGDRPPIRRDRVPIVGDRPPIRGDGALIVSDRASIRGASDASMLIAGDRAAAPRKPRSPEGLLPRSRGAGAPGAGERPRPSSSRADLADFMVEACESPTWVGKAVHLGG